MNLSNIINNYKFSCIILAAVELNLFDMLQEAPMSLDDFPTELHREPLERLLVALLKLGLVVYDDHHHQYSLSASGKELVSGTRASELSEVTLEQYLPAWSNLGYTIKTGKPALEKVWGRDAWEHRSQGEEGHTFISFMSGIQKYMAPNIVDVYDFGQYRRVVDIGAGAGYLLKAILQRWSEVEGVVFELPHVIPFARNTLESFENRCVFCEGSFFDSILIPKADLYVLQYILHDWDDSKCLRILKLIKGSAPSGSKLLVIENHTKDTLKDLHMMIVSGGKERTEKELHDLLKKAGLKSVVRVNKIISEASF